jgi:hypothetical protein
LNLNRLIKKQSKTKKTGAAKMPKNDNFVLKFFGVLLTFLISVSSFAGGISGGGGKGVLCQNKLQALDVYEMELRGEQAHMPYEDFDKNLAHFLKRTFEYMDRPDSKDKNFDLEDYLKVYFGAFEELKKNIVDMPPTQKLPLTKDATVPKLAKGCKEVQIIVMGKDGKIYRDLTYWNQLDDLNKIAFIVHEFMYYKARTAGAVDSDEARKTVGRILSNNELEPIFPKEMTGKSKLWCGAGGATPKQEVFDLYMVEEKRNNKIGIAIYFFSIGNNSVVSRTSGFIEGTTFQSLNTSPRRKIMIPVVNQLTGTQLLLEVKIANGMSFRVKRGVDDETRDFSNSFCRGE